MRLFFGLSSLVLVCLVSTGCAHRTWSRAEKDVGPTTRTALAEPEVVVTGTTLVGERGTVELDVVATEAPRFRLERAHKTFERGTFEPSDAHRKGNLWILGGSLAGLVPVLLMAPSEETGRPILQPGVALFSSAVVATAFSLVGVTQHISPALPPATRRSHTSTRAWTSTGTPVPAADRPILVRDQFSASVVGTGRTNGEGRARVDLGLPAETLVRIELDGVAALESVDLRTSPAWQLGRRAAAADLVRQHHYAEAKEVVQGVAGFDGGAWGSYCDALVTGWESVDLETRTEAMAGVPPVAGDCSRAWDSLDALWTAALLPVATPGPEWLAGVASTAALPPGHRVGIDGLRACVSAAASAEVVAGYERLGEMLEAPEESTRACATAARKALNPAWRDALAMRARIEAEWAQAQLAAERADAAKERAEKAFYRDDGFVDKYTIVKGITEIDEVIDAGLLCIAAQRQFGRGCDLRENAGMGNLWCSRNWYPAVKVGGRAPAEEVRQEFCEASSDRNGASYYGCTTYRGECVRFTVDDCLSAMKSWCD